MEKSDAAALPRLLEEREEQNLVVTSDVFQRACSWLRTYHAEIGKARQKLLDKLQQRAATEKCDEAKVVLESELSALLDAPGDDNSGQKSADSKRSRSPSSNPQEAGSKKSKLSTTVRDQDLLRQVSQQLSDKGVDLTKQVHQHTRIYSLEPNTYGMRGDFPYFKPCGWLRIALEVPQEVFTDDWPIAYHGTLVQNIPSILTNGLRTERANPRRQAGSLTGKDIYCSPSVEYASFPTYAVFEECGDQHWMQAVLQVRVRPGKFRQQPGTMKKFHWPEDLRWEPSFDSLEGLEWLIGDPKDIVVCGLMVRELGEPADPLVYGEAASKVRFPANDAQGRPHPEPNYVWSELREKEFRSNGLLLHQAQN